MIITADRYALITAIRYMIHGVFKFDADWTGHNRCRYTPMARQELTPDSAQSQINSAGFFR
jgi:hypothetical protein